MPKQIKPIKAWAVVDNSGEGIDESSNVKPEEYYQYTIFPTKNDAWRYSRRMDLVTPVLITPIKPAKRALT